MKAILVFEFNSDSISFMTVHGPVIKYVCLRNVFSSMFAILNNLM